MMPDPKDLEHLSVPVITSMNILINLKEELPQVNNTGRGFNPNSGSLSMSVSFAVPPDLGKIEEDGSLSIPLIELRRKIFWHELTEVASLMDIFKKGFKAGALVKQSEISNILPQFGVDPKRLGL